MPFSQKNIVYFEDEDDSGKVFPSNPAVDFTPPEYIAMLFTNEGVLTPASVSELILRSKLGKNVG